MNPQPSYVYLVNILPPLPTIIELRPAKPTRIRHVAITAPAPGVDVSDILIGHRSQFVAPIPVPLVSLMGAFEHGSADMLETIKPDDPLRIVLTCKAQSAFRLVLIVDEGE